MIDDTRDTMLQATAHVHVHIYVYMCSMKDRDHAWRYFVHRSVDTIHIEMAMG